MKVRSRAGQRGLTTVTTVLEGAMVIGWFVVLILGEKAVSRSVDARRAAETVAEEAATSTSADACTAMEVTLANARALPSILASAPPDVARAVALLVALGLGGERTFPSYRKPLL